MPANLVRYVSPFGSPATMPVDRALALATQDARRWALLEPLGLLTASQRRIGPPRLDDTEFHLTDLPTWHPATGSEWASVVRDLIALAYQRARNGDRLMLVIRAAEGFAIVPAYLRRDTDEIIWEARP